VCVDIVRVCMYVCVCTFVHVSVCVCVCECVSAKYVFVHASVDFLLEFFTIEDLLNRQGVRILPIRT